MQLCFFEDALCNRFRPLSLTRPVDDLRTGILTISEKWQRALNATAIARITRNELKNIFTADAIDPSRSCLWINARYLPGNGLAGKIRELNPGSCLQAGPTTIAAHVDGHTTAKWLEQGSANFNTLLVLEAAGYSSIAYPWDLYLINGEEIRRDLNLLQLKKSKSVSISGHAILECKEQIFIEDGVTIEPGVILSAKEGPVYLGRDVTVKAGSLIHGPVAVCERTVIKMGTKVYGGTTIGPVCKAGGEINNTIFHSYSNKAHEGYIGNSVIGQWCNFGAGTTVSNLKINYSNVRVTDWATGDETDTGQQFLGVIMGDHSKTAINSVIDSGSIFGVNSNILSRDFPPKHVPSFSWVGSNVIQPYRLDKAYDVMKTMMARRGIPFTEDYARLMEHIFRNARS